jgi:hypothetical protein
VTAPPDLLAEVATPALYRDNPFRLTGLPVTATTRDVRRRGEELRAAARLGVPPPVAAGSSVAQPDASATDAALRLLRDPVRRFPHEVFWLWRSTASSPGPPDTEPATGIAVHDAAVLAHAAALADVSAADGRLWSRAYDHWHRTVSDQECRRWLVDRVDGLADPRLRPDVVDRVLAELPHAVLSPQALLAVRAAESGQADTADRHVRALRSAPFGRPAADAALHRAARPIVARLRTSSEEAQGLDPRGGAAAVDGLVQRLRPPLAALRVVLGPEDRTYESVADAAAGAVGQAVTRYVNAGLPTDSVISQLVAASSMAAGRPSRQSLATTLLAGSSVALSARCQELTADTGSTETVTASVGAILGDLRTVRRALDGALPQDRHGEYLSFCDGVTLAAVAALSPLRRRGTVSALIAEAAQLAGSEATRRQLLDVAAGGTGLTCSFCPRPARTPGPVTLRVHAVQPPVGFQPGGWQVRGLRVPACARCTARWRDPWRVLRSERRPGRWLVTRAYPLAVLAMLALVAGSIAVGSPAGVTIFLGLIAFWTFMSGGRWVTRLLVTAELRRDRKVFAALRDEPRAAMRAEGWTPGAYPGDPLP